MTIRTQILVGYGITLLLLLVIFSWIVVTNSQTTILLVVIVPCLVGILSLFLIEQVIKNKQYYEATFQNTNEGIIVIDANLKIIALNSQVAIILNTNPKSAIGKSVIDVIKHQKILQLLTTTLPTEQPNQLSNNQFPISIEQDQQAQNYQVVLTPIETSPGQKLGVILFLQEINKNQQSNGLKSEFVATASHQLRTPLAGIAATINVLLGTAQHKLSPQEKQLLQAAAGDVEHLRALTNNLLDLSKIEAGRIEIEFIAVEVEFLLEKAISFLHMQAREKQVAIVRHNKLDSFQVNVDPNKIIWVLTNLIANALRYTDPRGEIRVSAKLLGHWIYFSVADDGVGIPPEYQAKIFDKFVQVKTDKDNGGSGLGLAICKEIVKAHKGKIWVDSQPGEGAIFTFKIPVG